LVFLFLFFENDLPPSRQDYASDGLRTLCLAYRDISEAEYRQWAPIYEQAATTVSGRGPALDKAAEIIEKDLFLLGADTIHTLQMAGIKVLFLLFSFFWRLLKATVFDR
jgi:phospholipid-transporting ATPase